jgi:hypothetical protein
MLIALLRWWYGPGWSHMFKRIGVRTQRVSHAFSAPVLLKTLFSPWKRIVTTGAKGLDAKMQAVLNNLISRLVGFTTRMVVLIAALVMIAGTFLGGALIAIVWPTVPFLVILFIFLGVRP